LHVVRTLNTIDYSLINELSRIDKPSINVVTIGNIICEFLSFIKQPEQFTLSG